MSLTAAFAAFDITPAIGMDIPGGFSPRPSTGVSMPLQARAAALENLGSGLIIIGVDAVSLNFDTANAIKAKISAATGLAPRRIAVVASHTHSGGPANAVLGTDANPAYLAELVVGAAQAGITAWRQRQPATLATGSHDCPGWAFNRRWLGKDGKHHTNPGKCNPDMLHPAGPADPEVAVIAVRDLDGNLLGMIANFTCHSTILSQSEFSPDYCGYWEKQLQARYGESAILVFLNGACGDINQIDFSVNSKRESGPEHAEKMAAALADAADNAIAGKSFDPAPVLSWAGADVAITYRPLSAEQLTADRALAASDAPWNAAKWQARDRLLLAEEIGDRQSILCPVDVYGIGSTAIAAAPWQPFCAFGLELKAIAPKRVMVAMLANGNIGYIPTPEAFLGGGYEPTHCRGSRHTPDTGGIISQASQQLLKIVLK
ncbi:MAG: hypothetical protein GX937_12825 [Lentisphaerae bacterium]|jgi:neutral ceramidase|nr:hypothetical protein [Lentisphaerota bacterium]